MKTIWTVREITGMKIRICNGEKMFTVVWTYKANYGQYDVKAKNLEEALDFFPYNKDRFYKEGGHVYIFEKANSLQK